MFAQMRPYRDAPRWAAIFLACAALAACATPQPRYAASLPGERAAPPRAAAAPAPSQPLRKGYKLGKPYQVGGIWYVPRADPHYDVKGVASWYGDQFHNRSTANGEVFNKYAMTAAHTTLPLPSIVEVTNLENGRKVKVRVNDRGPFVGGRVIDLSYAAARELGFDRKGLAKVRVRYMGLAPLTPSGRAERNDAPRPALAPPPIVQARAEIPAPPKEDDSTDVDWPAPTAEAATNEVADAAGDSALDAVATRPAEVVRIGPPPINPPDDQIIPASAFAPAAHGFRIQAGAFSQEANARKVAEALERAGAWPSIEPIERNGARLYRVTASAGGDEAQAFAIRDRLAGYGVFDARVIGPF